MEARSALPLQADIGTALILAAGTGSRLAPLTDNSHKCLTRVNGIAILDQQISALEQWGFGRLVIVLGHAGQQIREHIALRETCMEVEYIENPHYSTTNNLYSLWLARRIVDGPFVLIECDLFFDTRLIGSMLQPDSIAVAEGQSWMQGTTVGLDVHNRVDRFRLGGTSGTALLPLKTVNICSLSLASWREMTRRMDTYVTEGRVNGYYEAVLGEMIYDGVLTLRGVPFDSGNWYEIDTLIDLEAAERVFELAALLSNANTDHPAQLTAEHGD